VGIDCAADFIEMAVRKNKGYESKIDYLLSPIQDLKGSGDKDLVVGSYVLSYPKSFDEAVAYCKAIASWLKPGGKFVGFNNNPYDIFSGERYEKYGFRKVMTGDKEGAEVVYWVEGMTNPIINYYLSPETYERAFEKAGFSTFGWNMVMLEPAEQNNPYWDEFFTDESPFIAMIAEL